MAYYRPDQDAIEGRRHLEELKGKEGELIRYYVSKKDDEIKRLRERIKEMKSVFDGIAKYTR